MKTIKTAKSAGSRTVAQYAENHRVATVLNLEQHVTSSRTPSTIMAKEKEPVKIRFNENDYEWTERGSIVPRPKGYSFGGGPGTVRDNVKKRAALEMLEGGLLEMSHREKGAVHEMLLSLQAIIRDLLNVPKGYSILFTQGGAHAQFAAIPLNFGPHPTCVSCLTGSWSSKATSEQRKFAKIIEFRPQRLLSSEQILEGFKRELDNTRADYGYFCTNETMQGVQITEDSAPPDTAELVTDATSDLFSRKMDVSRYGVVFASGGKNLGPAGFAAVIVKDDIIFKREASTSLPSFLSWKEYAVNNPIQNLYNTPPLTSLGIARLVLEDLVRRGGVEWAERKSKVLSNALYNEIDSSNGFYQNNVANALRSRVSVVFGIPGDKSLESKFVSKAESQGLLQLVNHPSVGGMRASLYNALPVKAVETLIKFMREFKREHDV
jgi:phosphoserine aminotransferase